MQFPESWLRAFCNPPLSTRELADALTMAGFEVEETRPVAPPFSGVVVARVLEVEPHPNAEKLKVCRVDAGTASGPQALQIVCGAPNVRAGMTAPLAIVGAVLPPGADGKPFKIGVGKLRGVESRGMLCSARELGLSEDHGGLLALDDALAPGTDLRDALSLDDTLFTLKLTPNLGHVLSVYGVARELAAITGAPLVPPVITPVLATIADVLPARIEAADLCGRFCGRVIRGVNPQAPTPAWMVDRLARCGQRSVSALVDISNYVMFELGRPSHMFDLAKIEGGLVVRWAKAGEQVELLNGQTVTLAPDVGVIADAVRVESLAGVMGGDHTAVGDGTTDVYVEAAFWWPEAIAGRARRYKFSTDAAHRFERGVDPSTTALHIERLTELVLGICGTGATRVGPVDDHVVRLPELAPVRLRVERAARVIGLPLTQAECESVLTRLGFAWTSAPGVIDVTPPPHRFDIRIEEDLIEEVIRLVGFENLTPRPPIGTVAAHVPPSNRRTNAELRHAMAALGWQETINYSFVDERHETGLSGNAEPIRVVNPIARERAVMRSTLVGSLLDVMRSNVARRAARGRVFELGKVYWRDAGVANGDDAVAGIAQPLRLGALAWGDAAPLQWAAGAGQSGRAVDFFDVKGDVESLLAGRDVRFVPAVHPALHPGRSARVEVDGAEAGFVGELHPRWVQQFELPSAPVLFELDAAALRARERPAFVPLPKQLPASRDIAVVAGPAVTHAALMAAATGADPLVRSATLFDIYAPARPAPGLEPGERSLAIRLELSAGDEPLTDARIDAAVAAVLHRLQADTGVRLRTQAPAAAT